MLYSPTKSFVVTKYCLPGATVQSLANSAHYRDLKTVRQDFVYLLIGGNIIGDDTNIGELAKQIEDLVRDIVIATGGNIRIIKNESRTKTRGEGPTQNNKIKNAVNCVFRTQSAWTRPRYCSLIMAKDDLANALLEIMLEDAKKVFQESL